jgi:mono/diheme cytochrome c family protein
MNSRRILFVAIVAGVLGVGAALALGAVWPRKVSIAARPAPTEVAVKVAEGRHNFAMSCAHCHADDATGDEGPNLHKLKISDTHVRLILKNGIKGEMPNFAKKYDDDQITSIIAFLRTLD